jgi:hypothetical protein
MNLKKTTNISSIPLAFSQSVDVPFQKKLALGFFFHLGESIMEVVFFKNNTENTSYSAMLNIAE